MYFPWAGFMAQMALADVYIWLDDAQFSKGSFTNRIRVKTESGLKWMSIPLDNKGKNTRIMDLASKSSDWKASHASLLSQSLRHQPYLKDALEVFNAAIDKATLVETLIASAENPAEVMSIKPKRILRSSSMGISGSSWERVLQMVLEVGGTEYITGHGAANYLNHEAFESAGVQVSYMNYKPSPWHQSHGVFTPYVPILDLLSSVMAPQAASYLVPETVNWRNFI
jgi:hypothetical protein